MRGFLLVIATIICTLSYAQKRDVLTVVKLNNGDELTGVIVAYYPDSMVILKVGENHMNIPLDDISKIKSNTDTNSVYIFPDKKWWNRLSFSLLRSNENVGYHISNTVYYGFHPRLNVGAGIGIANYIQESDHNLIPLHVELISYLLPRPYSPYLALTGGYAMVLHHEDASIIEVNGGRMLAGRIGLRCDNGGIVIDLYAGLKFQKSERRYQVWEVEIHDKIDYNRLEMGIGLIF